MCFMKEKEYQILPRIGSQRVKGSNKSHGHSSKYFKKQTLRTKRRYSSQ